MSKLLSLGKSFLLCTVTCAKYVYCKKFLFILASYHCCCNKTLIRREAQDIWPRVSQDEDTGGIFALFPSCSQQKSRILFFSYICLQIPPPGVSSFMEMLVALLLFLQAAPTIRSQTTPPPVEDNNDLWALVGAF